MAWAGVDVRRAAGSGDPIDICWIASMLARMTDEEVKRFNVYLPLSLIR